MSLIFLFTTQNIGGGNAFVFGGEVAGGKLLGKYPERLDDQDPVNVGRGRLIPSVPWEGMW